MEFEKWCFRPIFLAEPVCDSAFLQEHSGKSLPRHASKYFRKNSCFPFQCSRLEGAIQQMQVNFASTHQRHKTEMVRLEETNKNQEAELVDCRKHIELLKEEITDKNEQLNNAVKEIASHKEDLKAKAEEVRLRTGQLRKAQRSSVDLLKFRLS